MGLGILGSPAVPALVCEDRVSVELSCKAVYLAFNSQPGSSGGVWNVRGLANNSWFRLRHRMVQMRREH